MTLRIQLILMIFLNLITACAQTHEQMTVSKWVDDLDYLESKIIKNYAGFKGDDRKMFQRKVSGLRTKIPSMTHSAVQVELGRLIATLGDGHTEISLLQRNTGFERLPVILYYFGEHLHIAGAHETRKELVNSKVIKIGKTTCSEIFDRLKPLLAHDNEMEFLLEVPNYMTVPAILHVLGIIESAEEVILTLKRDDGHLEEVSIKPVSLDAYNNGKWIRSYELENIPLPLYQQNPTDYYWYRYLQESKTFYFCFSQVDDQDGRPSVAKFIREMFAALDKVPVEKLVIDMRRNRGGNYTKSEILLEEIEQRPYLNQKGKLFVINGRQTFSAASVTTIFLKRRTQAILVGEPSRSNPNGTDNYESYSLPHSALSVGITNRLKSQWPELGNANTVAVDISIVNSFEDYRSGKDAVMEIIQNYK